MILCVNQSGPPVLACQAALHSALGANATNAGNGTYGRAMAKDVATFRTMRLGVVPVADGLMLDAGTIDALVAYMNQANRTKMDQPLTSPPDVRYDVVLFNDGDDGAPVLAAQN